MAGTKKGVQITVDEELSTVVIGGSKVEVSADGKRVTAYANGVETKAAPAPGAANQGTQINVSQGFNAVVLNGVTIEQEADGHLVIAAPGTVFAKPAVANDTTGPKPGDRMDDGTICAGTSPDTQKPLYTTPEDAELTCTFHEARKYAAKLDAHGHHDWRVPTKGELNVLWEDRNEGALKRTFNSTGSYPAGWYWSSTEHDGSAWAQRFSSGYQHWDFKNGDSSLRCVRG